MRLAGYLLTGLGTGCGFALVGSGLVAIYRVTRVVNFAQGAFAVVGAMCASSFLTVLPHGIGELAAVVVAAVVGSARRASSRPRHDTAGRR